MAFHTISSICSSSEDHSISAGVALMADTWLTFDTLVQNEQSDPWKPNHSTRFTQYNPSSLQGLWFSRSFTKLQRRMCSTRLLLRMTIEEMVNGELRCKPLTITVVEDQTPLWNTIHQLFTNSSVIIQVFHSNPHTDFSNRNGVLKHLHCFSGWESSTKDVWFFCYQRTENMSNYPTKSCQHAVWKTWLLSKCVILRLQLLVSAEWYFPLVW